MITGRYFPPHKTAFVDAVALLAGNDLCITDGQGTLLTRAAVSDIKISARLGSLARQFSFADGALFKTGDNDGADAMLAPLHQPSQSWINRLEHSGLMVLLSFAFAGMVLFLLLHEGVPMLADCLASVTPDVVAQHASDQTLRMLDKTMLHPSRLSDRERNKAQGLFFRVEGGHTSLHVKNLRLLFRNSPRIGANTFALPDGRIVMTDALWRQIQNDGEIEGVFAHEMAHVALNHGLKTAYEASLIPAILVVMTGDVSQISQVFATMPTILINASYSRDVEQEADEQAAETLRKIGTDPARMADLLQRLETEHCGHKTCQPSWLGDHPATADRVEYLRRQH